MVGSYNEFPQLAECGMQIDSTHIMRFADYGYNLPEDGLYVTEEFYQKHPETIQKLVRACIRGWNWANEHPEETLDIVMEQEPTDITSVKCWKKYCDCKQTKQGNALIG